MKLYTTLQDIQSHRINQDVLDRIEHAVTCEGWNPHHITYADLYRELGLDVKHVLRCATPKYNKVWRYMAGKIVHLYSENETVRELLDNLLTHDYRKMQSTRAHARNLLASTEDSDLRQTCHYLVQAADAVEHTALSGMIDLVNDTAAGTYYKEQVHAVLFTELSRDHDQDMHTRARRHPTSMRLRVRSTNS
jgi:hypothetical protein